MSKRFTMRAVVAASTACLFLASAPGAQAAGGPAPEVIAAERHDVSRPLRDIPVVWPKDNEEAKEGTNPPRRGNRVPAVSAGPDAAVRPAAGPDVIVNGLKLNFDGQGAT